jgi:hypothetical protein
VYRHDYIMRLIERFGVALRTLRDRILRREREDLSVRGELGEIARQAGLDLEVARTLDPAALMMWLAPSGLPDPARLWLMAELLYLEGIAGEADGDAGWRGDLSRAAALLAQVPGEWRPGPEFATAAERGDEIQRLLAQEDA